MDLRLGPRPISNPNISVCQYYLLETDIAGGIMGKKSCTRACDPLPVIQRF